MRLLQQIKAWAGLQPVMQSFELQFAKRHGLRPDTSHAALVGLNHSWVYACALRNATTAAGCDLNVYAREGAGAARYRTRALSQTDRRALTAGWHRPRVKADDAVELEDHPLAILLDKANADMTGPELFELTWSYLELTGNAYWYLERESIGGAGVAARSVPTAIYPLMAQYVKVVPGEDGLVTGYLYGSTQANTVAYDKSEVIHFRYPNPESYIYGMGPAQAAAWAAKRMESRSQYEQAMWDNDATPTLGISVEGTLSADVRQRLLSQFKQTYAGPHNKGKPIVLEGGLTVAPIGMAPQDTQMLENARFSREEIAAVFGVPMTLLEMSDANRASAEAGNAAYLSMTILPRLARMESKLNEELCPLFDDSGRLFVSFENPVPDNAEQEVKIQTAYIGAGVLSPNEVRAQMGLEPRDGGDDYKAAGGLPPQFAQAQPESKAFHSFACSCSECEGKGLTGEGAEPLTASERRMAAEVRRWYGARADEVAGRIDT